MNYKFIVSPASCRRSVTRSSIVETRRERVVLIMASLLRLFASLCSYHHNIIMTAPPER